MKNVFVKTKNVKRLVALLDEVQKLPPNIPKLALVYGEHGLGKTHSVIWWATRNDAIYVRANNEMTQNGLLKVIVEELGEILEIFQQKKNTKITRLYLQLMKKNLKLRLLKLQTQKWIRLSNKIKIWKPLEDKIYLYS